MHRSNDDIPNLFSEALNVGTATTATTTTTTMVTTITSTTILLLLFLPLLHRFVYKPQTHSLFSVQWF